MQQLAVSRSSHVSIHSVYCSKTFKWGRSGFSMSRIFSRHDNKDQEDVKAWILPYYTSLFNGARFPYNFIYFFLASCARWSHRDLRVRTHTAERKKKKSETVRIKSSFIDNFHGVYEDKDVRNVLRRTSKKYLPLEEFSAPDFLVNNLTHFLSLFWS